MRRLLGLLKSVIKFVLPKRGEIPLIVLGLFLLVVLLIPDFVMSSALGRRVGGWFEFSPVLMFCISIAAALGTFGWRELKRCRWFVVSIVAVMGFSVLLLYREGILFGVKNDLYQNSQGKTVNPVLALAVIFGTLPVVFLVTRLFFGLVGYVQRRFRLTDMTRQKLMIAVAIVLFICLTVRNVLIHNNLSLGTGMFRGPVYQSFESAIAVLLVVIVPAWLINRIRGWVGLLIGGSYLAVIVGFSGSFITMQAQMVLAVFSIFFAILFSSLTSYLGLLESQSNELGDSSEPSASPVQWAFWSVLILVIAIAATFVQWNYNGQALAFGGDDRLKLARQLKKISTNSDLNAQTQIWNSNGPAGSVFVSVGLELSDNAKANCLSEFSDQINEYQLHLSNLNPSVETSSLKTLSKQYISISDSLVTCQQLSDVISGANYVTLNGISIEEPFEMGSLGNMASINTSKTRSGEIAKLLQAIDETKFKGRVTIYQHFDQTSSKTGEKPTPDKLNEDDWIQILESSRSFEIYVYRPLSKQAIAHAIKKDVDRKLYVNAEWSESEFWDVICNTRISTGMPSSFTADSIERFFNAVFASRGEQWASRMFNDLFVQPGEAESFIFGSDSNWVFQRNQQGSPTAMLLPGNDTFIEQVCELSDLEILSLDVRWLQSLQRIADNSAPTSRDVSALGKLAKLKRLDMPVGFWGRDYAFLGQLPDLEHLQFDVMADGSKNVIFGFKAANCPNLKTMVLIGQPSKAMAIEIGKLPKLETLKVLDVNQSLATAKSVSQLQAAIGPSVELTIVVADEERPRVPEEFVEHLKKVRSQIRKKYLSDED